MYLEIYYSYLFYKGWDNLEVLSQEAKHKKNNYCNT